MTTNATDTNNKRFALSAVQGMAEHIERMEQKQHAQIREARETGASWTEIAKCLGVSKQAAQQKFNRTQAKEEAERARIAASPTPEWLAEALGEMQARREAAIAAGEYHLNP